MCRPASASATSHLAERAAQAKARGEALRADVEAQRRGAEVGLVPQAEAQHARRGAGAPQRRIGIIGVDDGGAAGGQPGDHLAFGARRALERTEAFQVLGAGVGDQADARARDLHQLFDVAAAIGAHLDHGAAVRCRPGAAASSARPR